MIAEIQLEDMQFFAYHGCFNSERVVGNNFRVDAVIRYDCEKASKTDNVEDALNYQHAYEIISKEMSVTSHILENVANRIITSLSAKFPQMLYVSIKIAKLNPPLGGKIGATSVLIEKKF